MSSLKETRALLKQKKAELEKIKELDQKINAGVYRSKGNVCPTKNGLKIALKRRDLEIEIQQLEEQSSLIGHLKAKKAEKIEKTEIKTKTLAKTKTQRGKHA